MKFGPSIVLFVCALLFAFAARCQESFELFNPNDSTLPRPEFGFRAGANVQTISGNDWVKANNTGLTAGFFAGLHKNKFGGRVEIMLSTTQFKTRIALDSDGNAGDFTLAFLDIPLLMEYTPVPQLTILLGPQYTNLVSVSKNAPFDADPKVVFKSSLFSAVIGAEVNIRKHYIVGARYVYGLSDLNNRTAISTVNNMVSTETWKTGAVQMYFSYRIK